ncbi:hypothetical protein [Oleidesulfovibrio sp.]|uniref:hypothetical protein n=1 Tax=Oleidesulfovibrio sp. TaxID=2909707 RepID=UPI003A8BA99C
MGFLNASSSFTRFKITDEISKELWGQIPEKLKQFGFKEIEDSADERGWGWVCFDDMLDAWWRTAPPEKGHYLTFSLRLDTRRISAAVVKKHLTLALREEEKRNQEQGKKFISRARKTELKEQVKLKLMARTLPVPAEFNVAWNMQTGDVFFASTQGKVVDLFTDYFTLTFDLHLEQLTPYSLALKLLGDEVQTKLDSIEPTSFA